ncbi:D-alanyl-lipoteichoic acid acyltransferase DltB, MBOAT superfamily [Rhizobiales bacterium GAS191]|nr:D-alanyl-lipoteichoic acid acyltransferase DltB, MBOAT superfamily [Rhizobiales bacterium GAS113]SEE88107.1 D-alanyl-lipoteichoic acid acyltransferase DltB, MBOAT superfamily [Rhizobiales bacterium GAS191]
MLFNSFPFLLVFLPAALAIQALAERIAPQARLQVLLGLSFAFYGYWDWRFVPLMAASILVNWAISRLFATRRKASPATFIIAFAIAANLLVLGIFKYTGFLAALANAVGGLDLPEPRFALPLGISFFTFHHVMYLTDLRAGTAPLYSLTRYGLYIGFFPQVLSGPLVRWSEVMHQFELKAFREGWQERLWRGLILVTLGLAKKSIFGDGLASYANPVFSLAAEGTRLTVMQAWEGVLAFTFQIYFDFSGYTDMALGVALMFGITLPQNFNRPYRAISLTDFWRRWHMTLSRFLRDYLYIPLGGNRHGLARQLAALLLTMGLGGLWHGAALTFVAWGVVHGLGLSAGVLWRKAGLPMPAWLGFVLTFLFVVAAWVLFRAPSFEVATRLYAAMAGWAPWGAALKWRLLLPAALFAMLGPTANEIAQGARPSRLLAFALALGLVLLLLKLGDEQNYEFIYFQF